MQNRYPIMPEFDLQLFADGAGAAGAAAGGAGEGAAQAAEGALPKADTKGRTGSSRRSKSGAYDNVVFGKQDAAAAQNPTPDAGETAQGKGKATDVTNTPDNLEAKRQAFKELIEGEYKDQYTEMFQQAFNRRFKEAKGMEQTIADQKPIIDMLMQRYEIGDGDLSKLLSAIKQDRSYWEEAAADAGLTVEQYMQMQEGERAKAELQQIRQQKAQEDQKQQRMQMAQQQLNAWKQEAKQLKQIYPSFDLNAELADPNFRGMLKNGISLEHAYKVKHMDEITAATARAAADAASAQTRTRIQNKAARPKENGMSTQSAAITKSDVHTLSRAERAEIARRVQRGDKIVF